jgi:hypothetical protein
MNKYSLFVAIIFLIIILFFIGYLIKYLLKKNYKFSKKTRFWIISIILIVFMEIIILSSLGKFIASMFLAGFIYILTLIIYSIYFKKAVIIGNMVFWEYDKKTYPLRYWSFLILKIIISLILFIMIIRYLLF